MGEEGRRKSFDQRKIESESADVGEADGNAGGGGFGGWFGFIGKGGVDVWEGLIYQ